MPREMSLLGDSGKGPAPVNRESFIFAAHALAVLEVHDSPDAQAKSLTIRAIAEADNYLQSRADDLTFQLFKTFGRNCGPVLRNFIANDPSYSDGSKISEFVRNIRRALNM